MSKFKDGGYSGALRALNRFARNTSSLVFLGAMAAVPALAQQSEGGQGGGIELVTVTAQYVTQDVQKTPLAISVVTAQDLEQRGISDLSQVSTSIPSLTLTRAPAAYGNGLQTYIRGIGAYDTAFAGEPGVGMYVDDLYFGTLTGSMMDLLDLNRIEVLKGPQGVLGGKNDLGGAVKLFTQKPTDDNGGYLSATYGSFNEIDVKGVANFTLIPGHLFMRLTASSRHQGGYVNVIDYACAHPSTAGSLPVRTTRPDCKLGTFGGTNVSAGRVAFKLQMGSHFEDNLAFDIVRDDSELTPDVLTGVDVDPRADPASGPGYNPSAALIYYNNGGGVKSVSRNAFLGVYGPTTTTVVPDLLLNQFQAIPTYGIPFDQRFIPSNPYTTSYATYNSAKGPAYNQGSMMHQWSMSNIMDWDVLSSVHLKLITGYREYQGAYAGDNSASPIPLDLAATYPTNREFQQEERITGSLFDGRLDWTAGAFYYNRENRATGPVIFDALNLVFEQNDKYTDENISGYAHGIFHITKSWDVFAGFRYTSEKKIYYFNHLGAVPGYSGSGFFRDTVDPACDYVISASCPANAPLIAHKATTERPDWRAGMQYQFTDDIMAYYQFSTGYRSGGFNSRPFDPYQLNNSGFGYGAEKIISHEIGAKTDWFDHRLRLNVALFDADYNNTVVPISATDPFGAPWVRYENIGSSTDKGFELEATAAPLDNMLLTANYSYVDYSANPAKGAPPGFVDPSGTVKVGSAPILFPQQQANFAAQYTFEMGDAYGSLTPRLDYNWRSVVYQDANNNPYTELPALGLLNGRLTWDAPNNWEVAFAVTNLTDEHYFLARFNMAIFGLGTVSSEPAAPREWMVTLKKSF